MKRSMYKVLMGFKLSKCYFSVCGLFIIQRFPKLTAVTNNWQLLPITEFHIAGLSTWN